MFIVPRKSQLFEQVLFEKLYSISTALVTKGNSFSLLDLLTQPWATESKVWSELLLAELFSVNAFMQSPPERFRNQDHFLLVIEK